VELDRVEQEERHSGAQTKRNANVKDEWTMSAQIWNDKTNERSERTGLAAQVTGRRILMALTLVVLVAATLLAASGLGRMAPQTGALPATNKVTLDNVRDFAPAASLDGLNYAIDGGELYAGRPLDWRRVAVPEGVIVGAVAVDAANPQGVYIGAANELALYRSLDGGENWLYVPLTSEAIGGVTDVAFDSHTRLLYVGTDTAGVFRLRDVGSSITSGGHYAVDAPVVEVAADSTGAGLAFFRTEQTLYRSENGGMSWMAVETLSSLPTALEVVNTLPPVVYVGTMDRGLLRSDTGESWMSANDGLNWAPGSRLHVDALAVDPQQPGVLYAATSYLYGSTTLTQSPTGVWMSANGGNEWAPVVRKSDAVVTDLMPVAGRTGAVFALTTQSRTPLALGVAPVAPKVQAVAAEQGALANAGTWVALAVAALAALWLTLLFAAEVRRPAPALQPAAQTVRVRR
jgi:hypothetical protein